ncbi:hypothetical protein [Paraburkholderia sp. A1RO-1]|uniref:hypothetical protein n=1 Tax=unclassified Paraburkholderia TaxID=2615204 RepID=UPI003B7B86C8
MITAYGAAEKAPSENADARIRNCGCQRYDTLTLFCICLLEITIFQHGIRPPSQEIGGRIPIDARAIVRVQTLIVSCRPAAFALESP